MWSKLILSVLLYLVSVDAIIDHNDRNAVEDMEMNLNNPIGPRVKRSMSMDLLASLAGDMVTYHQLEIFHNKTQVDKMENNVMLGMNVDNISLVRGQIMVNLCIL